MLIYYNYVFIYIISSVTHNLNLKVWKGNKCAAGKNFQILLFKLRIDARWNNLPLRNIPRPNRPTPPPPSPLKMKIFWFLITRLRLLSNYGGIEKETILQKSKSFKRRQVYQLIILIKMKCK